MEGYLGFRPACNLLLGKLLIERFATFGSSRERQASTSTSCSWELGPLIYLVATALETYGATIGKPKSKLLPVLLTSAPLEGTVDRTDADRRDLMTTIQKMLERTRAFADEALRDNGK